MMGPRMQLYLYDLCSKAGFSNMSVVPAATDTCEVRPGELIGFGAVATRAAADCCAACLAEPWCLAWSERPARVSPAWVLDAGGGTQQKLCELKDNTLPQPVPGPLPPDAFEPRAGNCGGTDVKPAAACNTSLSGSVKASQAGIASFDACRAFCKASCAACNFVSFSAANDDCSWYGSCDLRHLAHTGANYTSAAVRQPPPPGPSGVRVYHPAQELPLPRYGNCVVGGRQAVTEADNAAGRAPGVDAEWAAVLKEHQLADKCAVAVAPPPEAPSPAPPPMAATYFWTLMSQNGNAPASLGSPDECLPFCYLAPSATPGLERAADIAPTRGGYPPAVNASSARCNTDAGTAAATPTVTATADSVAPLQQQQKPQQQQQRQWRQGHHRWQRGDQGNAAHVGFNSLPMNQAKVMTALTDGGDAALAGSFNWTFELDADLAVPEAAFPLGKSLGVWSWRYDAAARRGVVRVYQRVSAAYPWICTYFGADVGRGVKANQAYDGRGMMTEAPRVDDDFIVRFFLNITRDEIGGGGGVGSWYLLNMEACWDQVTGAMCEPYGDTNTMVHNQVLLDYGGGDSCTADNPGACPPYHITRAGELVNRSDAARYPYGAYKFYCCPCTSCGECGSVPGGFQVHCCDALSNSNGQSIYKLAPDPEWGPHGFPVNATDGFVGHPKLHELHVGALWRQIWFPCKASQPIEIITVNIGPETGLGAPGGTHDTEFFVSDFDVQVPLRAEEARARLTT